MRRGKRTSCRSRRFRAPASEEDLVRRADELMCQVKRDGKGQLRHAVVEAEERPVASEGA